MKEKEESGGSISRSFSNNKEKKREEKRSSCRDGSRKMLLFLTLRFIPLFSPFSATSLLFFFVWHEGKRKGKAERSGKHLPAGSYRRLKVSYFSIYRPSVGTGLETTNRRPKKEVVVSSGRSYPLHLLSIVPVLLPPLMKRKRLVEEVGQVMDED